MNTNIDLRLNSNCSFHIHNIKGKTVGMDGYKGSDYRAGISLESLHTLYCKVLVPNLGAAWNVGLSPSRWRNFRADLAKNGPQRVVALRFDRAIGVTAHRRDDVTGSGCDNQHLQGRRPEGRRGEKLENDMLQQS